MPRRRQPAAPPAPRFHYVAEVVFDAEGDDARRGAVGDLSGAARDAAEGADLGDVVSIEVSGALASVDLSGTDPELRPSRLRHLADALVAQRARPNFPDPLVLRWRAA